jgi:hypothetical protein
MKFSATQEIALPADAVFARVTDFDMFEEVAERHGVMSVRLDGRGPVRPGCGWSVDFSYRGKIRNLQMEVADLVTPNRMALGGRGGGFEISFLTTVEERGPNLSFLTMETELRPRTLGARLLVNSMRFGKRALMRRYERRVAELARGIERWHRTGKNPWV